MTDAAAMLRNAPEPLKLLMGFQRLSEGTRDQVLVLERGKGIFVYDAQGREYIEAASSFYVAGLGYSEDELIEAAIGQMRRLPYYPSAQHRASDTAIALAEKIAAIAPIPDARVAFAATGSEANDFLLKFLRFANVTGGHPEKTKVIARAGSYHGGTLGSASLTGGHHEEFGLPLAGFLRVGQPDYFNLARSGETREEFATRMADDLEALILREGPETIAAFLTEPASFSCGLIVPPPTYWDKVQEVLRRYDVRCFADEVVTGFCRTGNLFGCETFGIAPDCMTLGKGLSGGYFPVSAIVMSGEFFDALEQGSDELGGFAHAATYAGHPVGAAVALKVIEIIERRGLVDHVRDVGPYLQKKLAGYADHPLIGDVRGVGIAGAIEFHRDNLEAASLAPSSAGCRVFCERAREHGLLVRGTGSTAIIAPPLIITRDQVDELFERFDRALKDTEVALANEGTISLGSARH